MNKSAKLVTTNNALINWDSGGTFNGYLLLTINLPVTRPIASLGEEVPRVRIPKYFVIPIKEGVFDENSRVLWTSAIEPPNTTYVLGWYDINNVFVALGHISGSSITIADDTDEKIVDPPVLAAP